MQQIICNFLFRYGYCPLPSVGTLNITTDASKLNLGEHSISAPRTKIQLFSEEQSRQPLIEFIANMQATDTQTANEHLENFVAEIKNLKKQEDVIIGEAGKFEVDENGYLIFTEQKIFTNYFPEVKAKRVVRANQSHEILVGDKETTNGQMTEYFTNEKIAQPAKTWLWISLGLIVAAVLVIFLVKVPLVNHASGNRKAITAEPAGSSYKTLP